MTGREHFMAFGPQIAKICIQAATESRGIERMETRRDSPQDAIMNCITWAATKQKAAFWHGFICAVSNSDYTGADGTRQRGTPPWREGNEMGKKAKENYENHQRALS